jgi:hypothetical protein
MIGEIDDAASKRAEERGPTSRPNRCSDLKQFQRLLTPGGVLISANLFLGHEAERRVFCVWMVAFKIIR